MIDKNYIKTEIIYKKDSKEVSERRLWIANELPSEKNDTTSCQSCHEPTDRNVTRGTDRNVTDNNTSLNNTFNNTRDIKDIVEQSPTTSIPYAEVIDYLNQKTGKNFKSTSKATQRHIKARFADGFTLDDFKQVIDTKTSQWLKDKKMSAYLRPDTLFGTKFESYLNEVSAKPKQDTSFSESLGLKVW